MNVKKLKEPKRIKIEEPPGPAMIGDVQFDSVEHLCESCGKRWALLIFNGECWMCNQCWAHFKMPASFRESLP